jgi:hypothetical protein
MGRGGRKITRLGPKGSRPGRVSLRSIRATVNQGDTVFCYQTVNIKFMGHEPQSSLAPTCREACVRRPVRDAANVVID